MNFTKQIKHSEKIQLYTGEEVKIDIESKENKDIIHITHEYEAVYGLGEKFDSLNQIGKKVVNRVEEKFCNQGNVSYCVTPFFFTNRGFGLFVHTGEVTTFDFQKEIVCEVPAGTDITFFNGSPKKIIAEYIEMFGAADVPPRYAFGPWISANHWNSQKIVEEQMKQLEHYNFPATVLVLEAWSDEATFYVFNGAKYDAVPDGKGIEYEQFDFSESKYWNNPKQMIENIHNKGIHLVLWQIPVYKQQDDKEKINVQNDLDRKNAVNKKLCVFNKDGTPYTIPEGKWFAGSYIPDFTNQDTIASWFEKRKYLMDIGVDGFKTDGGEFIYSSDVIFSNQRPGATGTNQYAQDYLNAYTGFLDHNKNILFSRAGYAGMHKTPCHWAGDHQSTNDELKAVLTAGLSSAMSGVSFWGFDIGGFAGPLPSEDLYRRSTQFACFSPIMQWHSEPDGGQFKELMPGGEGNNERSPWNIAKAYSNVKFIDEMRYWHWLRMNLLPYIYSEAINSVDKNTTMMRPLILEWPQDKEVIHIDDEYMFGESLLICPLMEENTVTRRVYLPEGKWYGFFSKKKYQGGNYIISKDEKYPVFIREGKALPLMLSNDKEMGTSIDEKNSQLIFLLAGDKGTYEYKESGKQVKLEWSNGNVCLNRLTEDICWELL